jgi:Zn-finger nucleic acid-binding protein
MRLKEGAEYLSCDYCGSVQFPEANSDGVRVLGEQASEPCPVCAIPLVHAVLSGQRILNCGRCRGILIEMDKFMAIVEDMRSRREASADAAHQPEWQDLNRRIRCPKCGQEMDTHPYYGPGNVIIDDCERCSVNWLDYGELERIVRAPDRQYVVEYAEPDPKTPSKT